MSRAGVPGMRGFSRDGVEQREPAAEILSEVDASRMRSVHGVEGSRQLPGAVAACFQVHAKSQNLPLSPIF